MYRRIEGRIWTDPKVKKCSLRGKLVFVYLITWEMSHLSGLYHLHPATGAADLGISEEDFRSALRELDDLDLIRFDIICDVVWVINMMRYQAKGDKANRAAANHLDELHNSSLVKEFLLRYPQVADRVSHRVYDTVYNGASLQKQKQKQNQKQNLPPSPPSAAPPQGETAGTGEVMGSDNPEKEIAEVWSTLGPPFRPISYWTAKRRALLHARWREPQWRERWREAMLLIPQRSFLRGEGSRGWVATLDWFLKPDSVAKILDGQYRGEREIEEECRQGEPSAPVKEPDRELTNEEIIAQEKAWYDEVLRKREELGDDNWLPS